MDKTRTQTILSNFDEIFELLFSLESIIKITHDVCMDKEVNSMYYDLPEKHKNYLSQERNHYINMLTLALDKLSNIKEINLNIEKELSYLK